MPASVLNEKTTQPTDALLNQALKETAAVWNTIKRDIAEDCGELIEEWKYYGQKTGWLLKILLKKRNLFFFNPQDGFFTLNFVFGDKAVAAVEESDLPEAMKETLRNARKYAEGRGLSVDVRSPDQVSIIRTLVEIKVNN
jgi:hypothetical protein